MFRIRPIIALLAFALLIQNTCPFDIAGKSTVAAHCEHCPLKYNNTVSANTKQNIVSVPLPIHYPLYVFSLPKTIHTFQLEPIQTIRPIMADSYNDAVPAELLRPPRA
jgi:hypothetical protein